MYIARERPKSCEETKASKARRPSTQSSTCNCTADPPPDKKGWEVGKDTATKTGGSAKGEKRKMEVEISKPCMQWEAAYEGTGTSDGTSKGLIAS